ncbi:MAG: transcriptional regulator [Ignavibacteria bacterium RBG_13_36_8]|nr:MAG: transcriptional regulator [Ignavibacteria bacterium RBG_13_36_8]
MAAYSKKNHFNTEAQELAEISKALSHPVRIQILKILTEKDICKCGEIVERLPLAQSTISQHLKELKRVGLIKEDIEGPKVCYGINKEMMKKARSAFTDLFTYVCKK